MRITGSSTWYFDRRDPGVDALAAKLGLAWLENMSTRYYRLQDGKGVGPIGELFGYGL